jgi:hypothetical protein
MPPGLRRGRRHPALDYRCPHCGAAPLARCTTPAAGITKTEPHPSRIATWVIAVAVCTTCQTAPGTPCHDSGVQRPDTSPVHDARYTEAEGTAA